MPWLLAVLLIFSGLSINVCSEALAGEKNRKLNILFISSFSADIPAQSLLESGLDRALGYKNGDQNIFFEFMDIPKLATENVEAEFASYLKKKYQGIEFDFIVGWDESAFNFLKNNDGAFNNAKQIFLEVRGDEAGAERQSKIQIELEENYGKSIQEVLRLEQPTHVLVIGTTEDPAARKRLARFKNEINKLAPSINITYLLDLTPDQVVDKLKTFPRKDTLAFYLLMFSDGKGAYRTPFLNARYLASRSLIPIYSFWESLMNSGVVGGYILSHEEMGFNLGENIIAMGRGEAIKKVSPMRFVYDWNALEKWGIDEDRLPFGSKILNRPPNILDQYRWHIFSVAIALIALSSLSLVLFRALRMRNAALNELDSERKNLAHKVAERTKDLLKSNADLTEEVEIHKQTQLEKERIIQELENALKNVKTLSGLLPICSACKNIRDDSGYWHQVEVYFCEHSEADFSHGICPECMKKLYPEEHAEMITGDEKSFSDRGPTEEESVN